MKKCISDSKFPFIASVQDGCGFLFYQSCHNIHFLFFSFADRGFIIFNCCSFPPDSAIQSTGGTCSHNSRRQRPWLNLVDSLLLIFFSLIRYSFRLKSFLFFFSKKSRSVLFRDVGAYSSSTNNNLSSVVRNKKICQKKMRIYLRFILEFCENAW